MKLKSVTSQLETNEAKTSSERAKTSEKVSPTDERAVRQQTNTFRATRSERVFTPFVST
jgi:hypothetical protein